MASTINANTSGGLISSGDTSGVLQLQTASTTALTIDTSANVGIGTASPPSKLSVKQSANSTTGGLQLIRSDSANYTAIYMGGDDLYLQNTAAGGQIFYTNNTERMRITSGGYVGIGTTNPLTKLVVKGTHVSGQGLINIIADSGTRYSTLSFTNDTTQKAIIFHDNTDNYLYVYGSAGQGINFTTNDTTRMLLTSGGSLLIGATSSPTASTSLFAASSGNYTFCLNSGAYNYFFGTASNQFNVYDGAGTLKGYLTSSGTWTNTSDIAFKKDIVDIKYNLQDALNLRPVSYLTKDYDEPQIGFIAQEVEQIIPEVVSGEEGSKGISYGSLVALCVKAIQEQQALITDLTTRLAALEGAK
jgi:hypothetical protein